MLFWRSSQKLKKFWSQQMEAIMAGRWLVAVLQHSMLNRLWTKEAMKKVCQKSAFISENKPTVNNNNNNNNSNKNAFCPQNFILSELPIEHRKQNRIWKCSFFKCWTKRYPSKIFLILATEVVKPYYFVGLAVIGPTKYGKIKLFPKPMLDSN